MEMARKAHTYIPGKFCVLNDVSVELMKCAQNQGKCGFKEKNPSFFVFPCHFV